MKEKIKFFYNMLSQKDGYWIGSITDCISIDSEIPMYNNPHKIYIIYNRKMFTLYFHKFEVRYKVLGERH